MLRILMPTNNRQNAQVGKQTLFNSDGEVVVVHTGQESQTNSQLGEVLPVVEKLQLEGSEVGQRAQLPGPNELLYVPSSQGTHLFPAEIS